MKAMSLAALTGVLLTAALSAETADQFYHNGPIVTINDDAPTAKVVAVKDGKVLAVGAKDEVLKTNHGLGVLLRAIESACE
jgi:hypothetical protein